VRLFSPIVRFDAVYSTLFKCTRKRIGDYPNLSMWLREVYQLPGIRETVDLPGVIRSYYVQVGKEGGREGDREEKKDR